MTAALNVLIASPLEAEHASRIPAADPRVNLLYEPELLPVPRYPCDHTGPPGALDAAALARWAALRAAADISFAFDWQSPDQIDVSCPRLRWIQGTSAGIGGLLDRTGLVKTSIVFTTAAGVHGAPLAEFALLGLLHFAKGMPRLARQQASRHWERHAMTLLRGSRVLLVGLGGVGREVARLLAAVGVEVYGAGLPGRSYHVPGVSEYVADERIREVLGSVDALILACPLTERTQHLIGGRELAMLRPGSVVVNLSRGQAIDERALIEAPAAGRRGGPCPHRVARRPLSCQFPLLA